MAGIGFELKKIYRKEGISRALAGAAYSSVVTIGPTLTVIAMILFLYVILGMTDVPFASRELLSSAMLYIFIFSVILTAPFNSVFSRYLADEFYNERFDNILPSYYVGIFINASLGSVIAVPAMASLIFRGGVDLPFVGAAYVLWISSVVLFFSVTYLHATKDYKIVALYFLVGMGVTGLTSVALYGLAGCEPVHAILYGMAVGFFTIAFLEISFIKRYFKKNSSDYMGCIKYIFQFKRIFFTQLFYMLGLYVHNFVFWTTDQRLYVAKTFYSHQAYDMASCLAMFTNISTMILFTVVAETRFHDVYQIYMECIIGGTYKLIQKNKKIMFRTLMQQINQVFGMQIAVTAVFFMLILVFGPTLGFSGMLSGIYPMLAVSYLGIFLMYGNIIYLYYFDDRTGTLITSILFFIGTFAGSLVSKELPVAFYGAGSFIGMFLGFTFSYFRIRYLERNFEAHIFCNYKIIDTMKSSKKGAVVYRRGESKD